MDQKSNTKQETVEIGTIDGTYMNTRSQGRRPRSQMSSAYSCADLRYNRDSLRSDYPHSHLD